MAYNVLVYNRGKTYYCRPLRGILNMAEKRLGREFPHLVKDYKTKSGANRFIKRITEKYTDDMFLGNVHNYAVKESFK